MTYMPKSAVPVGKNTGYMPKSAVPVKTESSTPEWLKGDALPNIGQMITGVASLPVTAPMSVANPTLGKVARASIGTLGRAGGEIVRQGLESAPGDLDTILKVLSGRGNEVPAERTPGTPEARAKAGENLNRMGKEVAAGLSSEVFGEFLLGPLFNKGSQVVTPLLGKASKVAGEGLETVGKQVKRVPILGDLIELAESGIDLAKGNATSAVNSLKDKSLRYANTILELNQNNALRSKAQNQGVDLGKEFTTDIQKFGKNAKTGAIATTKDELYTNVEKYRDDIAGPAVESSLKGTNKTIDLTEDIALLEERGAEMSTGVGKLGKVGQDYVDTIDGLMDRYGTNPNAYDAWKFVKQYEPIIRGTNGNIKPSGEFGSGEMMAYVDFDALVRKRLKDIPEIKDAFFDYQKTSMYLDALSKRKVKDIPKESIISMLNRAPSNVLRNQEFLVRQLLRKPEMKDAKMERFEAMKRILDTSKVAAPSAAKAYTADQINGSW